MALSLRFDDTRLERIKCSPSQVELQRLKKSESQSAGHPIVSSTLAGRGTLGAFDLGRRHLKNTISHPQHVQLRRAASVVTGVNLLAQQVPGESFAPQFDCQSHTLANCSHVTSCRELLSFFEQHRTTRMMIQRRSAPPISVGPDQHQMMAHGMRRAGTQSLHRRCPAALPARHISAAVQSRCFACSAVDGAQTAAADLAVEGTLANAMPPFHLAFPVHDVAAARDFYGEKLGCPEGRSARTWVDYSLYGHQIVCHHVEGYEASKSANAVDGDAVPVPHFGLALSVPQFHELAERVANAGIKFVIEPHLRFEGQPGEQYTMFFTDQSGNALEFKAMTKPENLYAKYAVDT